MEVENQILEMVKQIVEDESVRKTLSSDTDLMETEVIDSLGIAQLIIELEDAFPIGELDVDDIIPENFTSVKTIAALVEMRMEK